MGHGGTHAPTTSAIDQLPIPSNLDLIKRVSPFFHYAHGGYVCSPCFA